MPRGRDQEIYISTGTAAVDLKDAGLDATGTELLIHKEWSALIRHLMACQGIEDRYRTIMAPAIRSMARAMANTEINLRERELLKERASMLEAYSGFVKVARDLVAGLDLGPFDEVVSVAVKRADGRIDVVEIG